MVNEELKERFKDKRVFDEFALPLLKISNPTAHPLTLSTLLRAKWFEVMNTETAEDVDTCVASEEHQESSDKATKNPTYSRQVMKSNTKVSSRIKVNFNYF